jgi:hypothetical protein
MGHVMRAFHHCLHACSLPCSSNLWSVPLSMTCMFPSLWVLPMATVSIFQICGFCHWLPHLCSSVCGVFDVRYVPIPQFVSSAIHLSFKQWTSDVAMCKKKALRVLFLCCLVLFHILKLKSEFVRTEWGSLLKTLNIFIQCWINKCCGSYFESVC